MTVTNPLPARPMPDNSSAVAVLIHARLWFSSNGSTYHTWVVNCVAATGEVVQVAETQMQYGYGRHYETTARKALGLPDNFRFTVSDYTTVMRKGDL